MKSKLLVLALLFAQLTFAQKKTLPFRELEATSKEWVSGAPGGGAGTLYSVKVMVASSHKIDFKNFWMGKDNVPFDIGFYSTDVNKKVQKGDSVLITYNHVTIKTPRQEEKSKHTGAKQVPFEYKGAAMIEYSYGGRARYFIVKEFKKAEPSKGQ